jgi:hypothetical protein
MHHFPATEWAAERGFRNHDVLSSTILSLAGRGSGNMPLGHRHKAVAVAVNVPLAVALLGLADAYRRSNLPTRRRAVFANKISLAAMLE